MPVKRILFDVEYNEPGGPTEYRVRVTMSDRLMAESRGRQYGLMDQLEQPNLAAFLWLYFASIREGHIPADTEFRDFQTRCIDNTAVGAEDVDPTRAASRVSPPSSPSGSLASTGAPESSTATTG